MTRVGADDKVDRLWTVDLDSEEPAMTKALLMAFRAAEADANILILGQSGTGKSVLAREIHKRSARRESAFVTVNCPSLSRELFESRNSVQYLGRIPNRNIP